MHVYHPEKSLKANKSFRKLWILRKFVCRIIQKCAKNVWELASWPTCSFHFYCWCCDCYFKWLWRRRHIQNHIIPFRHEYKFIGDILFVIHSFKKTSETNEKTIVVFHLNHIGKRKLYSCLTLYNISLWEEKPKSSLYLVCVCAGMRQTSV